MLSTRPIPYDLIFLNRYDKLFFISIFIQILIPKENKKICIQI